MLSYRDGAGPRHPLTPVLGDLVSGPDTRRLQLTPLSRAAVAELVGGHGLDPADVHARTAGNPFFVSQILAQPDSPLPESVRDAVVARTASLAAPARRALELLSCAPDGVSGELLAALDVPQATVEALAATGLLDRRGGGVAFRHEIARSAVLDAVAPGAEPALHAAMIEALERIGGDSSVLAHHAAAAADVPRILRYAPAAAAEAARSGAHREAVAFYEHALRHTDEADAATRATLLEALAWELYLTDRLADAIAARTRALELRRELGDVVAVGAAHRTISYFEWYAADRAAAERQDGPRSRSSPAPGSRASWATRWPTAPTWPRSAATARRPGRRASRRSASPTSWATPPCAAPRRSAWRWSACRAATRTRDRSCSRSATPGCGCGSTSWPPRR